MMKVLPPNAFAELANVKCGEIFCQSSTSFSIVCSFCEIKCFKFRDFHLHFKNAHFENDLLKTDELPLIGTDRETLKHELAENLKSAGEFDAPRNEDDGDDWCSNGVIDDVNTNAKGNDNSNQSDDGDANVLKNGVAKVINWKSSGPTMSAMKIRRTSRQLPKREEELANDENIVYELGSDCENADADPQDLDYKPRKNRKQNVYKCENCERVYLNKGAYTMHMKREHSNSELVICAECNLQCPGPRQHDNHAVEIHGGLACMYGCGKRYKCRRELQQHEVKHTGERSVVCDYEGCSKRFFTMRNMHSHRKVHSLEKNFVCENCGYSCRNKETLRVHSRTHTGERPYACKTCPKRFPSHSGLREHEVMHSSVRPHVCAVCGATFARQKALYHHKFLHLEEKKFVCKICGNAFAQQAGLAGHMRKHKEGAI